MIHCQIPFADIEAWLFDLDGTLMDTDNQTVDHLVQRLRFLNPTRARRLARRAVMFSETPMNGLVTMVDIVGLDPLMFYVRRLLSRHKGPLFFPIIEGVLPLLNHLATQVPLAVVSTRSHEAALAFLNQYELVEHFAHVVTQESTKRLKPHPEPVRYAAQQLGLPPERCVMVGDTPVDILSAKRAGAWSVGVLCGFGEAAELQRAGANLILPTTGDLLPLVRRQPDTGHSPSDDPATSDR